MTTATDHSPAPALDRAVSAYKAGNLVEVEQLCQEIITTNQNSFDALYLLAFAQSGLGKIDAALATYNRVLTLRPDFAEAHFNRGNLLQRLKRHDEALASYDRALALRPDFARVYFARGKILHELKRYDEALVSQDRVIQLLPEFVAAHFERGNILFTLGRYGEALASFDRVLALNPGYAAAHMNRANVLQALKRYDEALASYERAIALEPDFADTYSNRGGMLERLKRYDEALASYDRAIALRPDHAAAHFNRGTTLLGLKRFVEAVESFDRALAVQPDFAEAHLNRGNALQELKRHAEAVTSYERAIMARPDYVDAHYNEALSRLLVGDFERGWEENEWRWETDQLRDGKRFFKQPLWLGKSDIAGKTILLHGEQGFGDTIQFCRYVPMVAERGARVIVEVQEPLKRLMSGLSGTTQLVARGKPLPEFDIHCPLFSLPLAFGTRLETIPSAVPYLRASPQAVADWGARLGPKHRPRVGLAWSGRPIPRDRSIPLRSLLAFLDVNATFVSLQKEVTLEDAKILSERSDLLHFGDALKDFADTAALIANLDLVISIDTSIANLAGALAAPLWVMLLFTPDWRWLLDRDDNPWYPTARLFRQDDTHTWDSVIARVQTALRDFVQCAS